MMSNINAELEKKLKGLNTDELYVVSELLKTIRDGKKENAIKSQLRSNIKRINEQKGGNDDGTN